jgi:outer membrane protein
VAAVAGSPCCAARSRCGAGTEDRLRQQRACAARGRARQGRAGQARGEFGKRDRELVNDQAARAEGAADKLEKDAPTLSETERNRRQRELVEQDRDLQRKRREFQEDLNQRKNEELATVVERANRVIKQIFDAEKYDLILQEAIFAGPRVDITDKVIKALNAPRRRRADSARVAGVGRRRMLEVRSGELAAQLGGELLGDGALLLRGIAALEDAGASDIASPPMRASWTGCGTRARVA